MSNWKPEQATVVRLVCQIAVDALEWQKSEKAAEWLMVPRAVLMDHVKNAMIVGYNDGFEDGEPLVDEGDQ